MRVLAVRHAEPVALPGVDPGRWALSRAGRAAAHGLGARLPHGGLWVSSTERKAHETLLLARGEGPVTQDARLDEVRRNEPFDDGFRARRRAWVAGDLDERHAGWESPRAAAARFESAVAEYAERWDLLVIGTHGMVLTAWLAHARRTLSLSLAPAFWEHLRFPDVIGLDATRQPPDTTSP